MTLGLWTHPLHRDGFYVLSSVVSSDQVLLTSKRSWDQSVYLELSVMACPSKSCRKYLLNNFINLIIYSFIYLFELIPPIWTKINPQKRFFGCACPCKPWEDFWSFKLCPDTATVLYAERQVSACAGKWNNNSKTKQPRVNSPPWRGEKWI